MLKIARCTGRGIAHYDFLGAASTHSHGYLGIYMRLVNIVSFFLGQHHRIAAGTAAARYYGYLMHRIAFGYAVCHYGMTCLVICYELFVQLGNHAALLFRTHAYARYSLLDVVHRNDVVMLACGEYGTFVEDIRQVGTGEVRSALCQYMQIN